MWIGKTLTRDSTDMQTSLDVHCSLIFANTKQTQTLQVEKGLNFIYTISMFPFRQSGKRYVNKENLPATTVTRQKKIGAKRTQQVNYTKILIEVSIASLDKNRHILAPRPNFTIKDLSK